MGPDDEEVVHRTDHRSGRPGALPDTATELAQLGAMGELLPDGLVVVGGDRVVRFANGEALRILERAPTEILHRSVAEGLTLRDKDGRDWWAHTDPWGGLSTRTGHREKLLVGPAGNDLLVTARYLRADRGGPVERVMLGLRDAEARLRAERDQATVLTTVAHELRAPLTSVAGFTSSLLRRWERFTDAQKKMMIETIESDANRLTRLITELLDISRLDTHALSLRLGPVDLHEVLTGHVLRHELGRRPGSVQLRLGSRAGLEGLPELWADADRLEQVFHNLVENGLRHGSGVVTVTLERDDHAEGDGRARGRTGSDRPDAVTVTIDDEGDGIPPEHREKVFGRFWHGPSNASTGLGLYVVRGLVEAHGGSVWADANEAGGARFVVRLPSGLPDLVGP